MQRRYSTTWKSTGSPEFKSSSAEMDCLALTALTRSFGDEHLPFNPKAALWSTLSENSATAPTALDFPTRRCHRSGIVTSGNGSATAYFRVTRRLQDDRPTPSHCCDKARGRTAATGPCHPTPVLHAWDVDTVGSSPSVGVSRSCLGAMLSPGRDRDRWPAPGPVARRGEPPSRDPTRPSEDNGGYRRPGPRRP